MAFTRFSSRVSEFIQKVCSGTSIWFLAKSEIDRFVSLTLETLCKLAGLNECAAFAPGSCLHPGMFSSVGIQPIKDHL